MIDRAEAPDGTSSSRRPRRRPGENRERLLEAGIHVFGTHGYHGAATAAIASLAGVPQPHVYANFRSKQQLFLACAERVRAELLGTRTASDRHSLHGLFLLQALAVVSDEQLRTELRPLLTQTRAELGEQAFEELLTTASNELL